MITKFKNKFSKDVHLAELLQGTSVSFVCKIVGMLLGYIFTLLIAKWYGAEAIGFFTLSLVMLNIFITLGLLGFDNALVKLVADYNTNNKLKLVKEVYQKSLDVTIPAALVLSIVLYFASEYFANIVFKNEALILYFQITSVAIVPFVLLRVNTATFRGLKMIKEFSFFEHISIFMLSIIFFVLLYFLYGTKETAMISQVTALCIVAIISYFKLKSYMLREKLADKVLKYKNILSISLPMLLTSSLALIMGWTDIIMLGIFRSEEEVGVYGILIKLAGLTTLTLIAVNSIAAPKFSEFYSKNDMKGLKKVVQNSTKLTFYTTLPVIMVLTIFPEFILGIFGEEFIIGVTALWILMFGQFISTVSGSVGNLLVMTGKQALFNKVIVFSTALNIVLNYFLINIYGIVGAAVATMISISILNILPVFFVRYYYGFYSFNFSGVK